MLALLAVAVFGTYLFLSLALRNRRVWLPVGIVFNLALLAFFKYKLLFLDPASPSLVDFAPLEFLLVERYARGDSEPLFFRPIRAAVAAYEQRRHAPLTHDQVALNLRRLTGQPPSDFDNKIHADRALQQFEAEDPTDTVQFNAKRIGELIRAVEQRGARVLLFELPYSESIERSRYAATTREIVRAAFPGSERWLAVEVNRSELRWADGVHLDERSAVIMAQAMEHALASARK